MSGLSVSDFELLSTMLKQRSGLIVTPEKGYLLESRLTPIARRRGMPSLVELAAELRSNRDPKLAEEITEAMTTNESFFFRDQTPFDIFKQSVLPYLAKTRATTKRVRIWCAAASTGQEPYSLAMILKEEAARWAGWTFEIIGTDISQKALSRALAGEYSQFEVQRGLPIQLLMKYFTQGDDHWKLSADIRGMVKFKVANLLQPLNALGQFDVVFCRNVLIYFDAETKSKVLNAIRGQMPVDGSLFLGAAETVLGLSQDYKPVRDRRGLYVPSDSPLLTQAA